MRDLPYSWQILCENVHDPAHVSFSHHGVQGAQCRTGVKLLIGVLICVVSITDNLSSLRQFGENADV